MKTALEILNYHLREELPDKNCVLTYVETRHIIAAMEEYAAQDKWVSVKDRLPGPGVKVLVLLTYGGGSQDVRLSYTSKRFPDAFDSFHNEIITHWQPLPKL